MKKKTFLKLSSSILKGLALTSLTGCAVGKNEGTLRNWAGNLNFATCKLKKPVSVEG